MVQSFFILLVSSILVFHCSEAGRVKFQHGLTWANRAWGSYKEKDSLDGQKVVDVDLFDTSKSEIASLKSKGHLVICYVSAGTVESWRADYKQNKADWDRIKAKSMSGWGGETWLDITKLDQVIKVMKPRWEYAKEQGCDAIEADNVDCYSNKCVPGQSREQLIAHQKKYSAWQTNYAHSLNLGIGLKNSMALIEDLAPNYDFGVNEECVEYGDCKYYEHFKKQNKACFGTEYTGSTSRLRSEGDIYGLKIKVNYGSGWQNLYQKASALPKTEYY